MFGIECTSDAFEILSYRVVAASSAASSLDGAAAAAASASAAAVEVFSSVFSSRLGAQPASMSLWLTAGPLNS